jgi:hypothetical protein
MEDKYIRNMMLLAIAESTMQASAMQSFLKEDLSKPLEYQRGKEWVAKQSFDMADAMMKEFDKRKSS